MLQDAPSCGLEVYSLAMFCDEFVVSCLVLNSLTNEHRCTFSSRALCQKLQFTVSSTQDESLCFLQKSPLWEPSWTIPSKNHQRFVKLVGPIGLSVSFFVFLTPSFADKVRRQMTGSVFCSEVICSWTPPQLQHQKSKHF